LWSSSLPSNFRQGLSQPMNPQSKSSRPVTSQNPNSRASIVMRHPSSRFAPLLSAGLHSL
jgi:hypothetical protein